MPKTKSNRFSGNITLARGRFRRMCAVALKQLNAAELNSLTYTLAVHIEVHQQTREHTGDNRGACLICDPSVPVSVLDSCGMAVHSKPSARARPRAEGSPMKRTTKERGQALIEFALVAIVFLGIVFSALDLVRMVSVKCSLVSGAQEGLALAVVRGSTSTSPLGPGPNPPPIVAQVLSFAGAGLLNPAGLTVNVKYPSGSNHVGDPVQITVSYAYDSWALFPVAATITASGAAAIVE